MALLFGENAVRIRMGLFLCFPNRFYFYIEGANISINLKQIQRGHVDRPRLDALPVIFYCS